MSVSTENLNGFNRLAMHQEVMTVIKRGERRDQLAGCDHELHDDMKASKSTP